MKTSGHGDGVGDAVCLGMGSLIDAARPTSLDDDEDDGCRRRCGADDEEDDDEVIAGGADLDEDDQHMKVQA